MGLLLARQQKDISRFFQSPVNVALAQILPFSILRLYFYTLGLLYYAFERNERLKVTESVSRSYAGQHPSLKLSMVILKTVLGICEHYFEKMINAHGSLNRMVNYLLDHVDVQNGFWLDGITRAERGCLMITGHFGAVEYLPLFLAARGYKLSMVIRFKTSKLKDVLMSKSKQFDARLIDADRSNVVHQALESIRQGRILITLCDEFQHWKPHCQKLISVLGTPVPQDKTLDIIYSRARAPACLGLMRRDNGKYTLHIDPISDGNSDNISLAALSWQILERYIRRYPEQWYQWQEVAERLAAYRLN